MATRKRAAKPASPQQPSGPSPAQADDDPAIKQQPPGSDNKGAVDATPDLPGQNVES